MAITLISPNKISALYAPVVNHFDKMLLGKVKIKQVENKKKLIPQKQMQYETELMLKEIPPNAYIIAMDATGHSLSSEQFAGKLATLKQTHKNIIFIIGGPYGIASELINKAHYKLSLSAMTLPNQLAIVTIFEQIYRAETIASNHPYHK